MTTAYASRQTSTITNRTNTKTVATKHTLFDSVFHMFLCCPIHQAYLRIAYELRLWGITTPELLGVIRQRRGCRSLDPIPFPIPLPNILIQVTPPPHPRPPLPHESLCCTVHCQMAIELSPTSIRTFRASGGMASRRSFLVFCPFANSAWSLKADTEQCNVSVKPSLHH